MTPILEGLQDSSFKGVAIFDEATLKAQNYKREVKLKFEIIEQKINSHNFGVDSNPESFLNPIYLKKIPQLIEGGFFQLWFERASSHRSLAEKVEEDDKVVLTMDHLGVGFIFTVVLLLISMVAFIGELLLARILKRCVK